MRLFEMGDTPREAGLARLQFVANGMSDGPPPFRKGRRIFLPDHPETEFFPLMNGVQFLLRRELPSEGAQYWFGGTDEQPFLVRLRGEPFGAFQKGGEDSFYAALKPGIITMLEQTFGVSTKRQGDFFAVPLPYSWEAFQQATTLCRGVTEKLEDVKEEAVFGTRHTLTGLRIGHTEVLGEWHMLSEGVLKAPDHAPLELPGVHVIIQAQNLYQPTMAD